MRSRAAIWAAGRTLLFLALTGGSQLMANTGLLVERVEVGATRGSGLLRTGLGGEALWKALQPDLKTGDAVLLESNYQVVRDGEANGLVAGHELMYPTEWDPAELPQKLAGPLEAGVRLMTNSTPTGFEVRTIGWRSEWEQQRIDAEPYVRGALTLASTTFIGTDTFGRDENRHSMPRIGLQRLADARQRLPFLRRALVAVHHSANRPDRMVMVFAQCAPQSAPIRKEGAFDPFAPGAGKVPDERRLLVAVDLIETSAGSFAMLMAEAPQIADWGAQREQLERSIDAGDARAVASRHLLATSGKKVRGSTAAEYVYPVSGDPPEIPQQLKAPDVRRQVITSKAITSTEVRPLGLIVEAEPEVTGGVVDLGITIEHTALVREITYGERESAMAVPLFDVSRVNTKVSLGEGSDLLLAALTPREGKSGEPVPGRRLLVFVRVSSPQGEEQ